MSSLSYPDLPRVPVMFFWRLHFLLLMDIPWCLWIAARLRLDSFVLLLLRTFHRIWALLFAKNSVKMQVREPPRAQI